MDWPLSQHEKRSQLLRIYDKDAKAADLALDALRTELENIRNRSRSNESCQLESQQEASACADPNEATRREAERLRVAVESASAVFRAILQPGGMDDCDSDGEHGRAGHADRGRAKSEGALPHCALKPALRDRCATPRRKRVSFGNDAAHAKSPQLDADHHEPEPEQADGDEGTGPCRLGSGAGRPWVATGSGHFEVWAAIGITKLGITMRPLPPEQPILSQVEPGSWAAEAGLVIGDHVLAVNGCGCKASAKSSFLTSCVHARCVSR